MQREKSELSPGNSKVGEKLFRYQIWAMRRNLPSLSKDQRRNCFITRFGP